MTGLRNTGNPALTTRVYRVNVNFSDSAYRTLQSLAERKGKTMSEILRDAIALEKWFQDVYADGGRVLLERNGETREIVPR